MADMRIGVDIRCLSHGLVGGEHTSIRYLVPAGCIIRYLPYRHSLSGFYNDLWRLRFGWRVIG